MVTMTYTQIGNTGINFEDTESKKIWTNGFIVKEYMENYSNFRAEKSLGDYLKDEGIVAIEGVDTRFLTRHLRDNGSMTGIIATGDRDPAELIQAAKDAPSIIGLDLAAKVTCDKPYDFYEGSWQLGKGHQTPDTEPKYKVVAFDFGIKTNIVRMLVDRGCKVTVVPADTTASAVLEMKPDGVFLSNGPGDPEGVPYAAKALAQIIKKNPELPIFGICLGHQILSLSLGAKTEKLKFGHHGANHPVMDLATREVAITSQNHNFSVPVDFFEKSDCPAKMTHLNLNDRTCEGMEHKELPLFSVQYHPEASPGPHDAEPLFDKFISHMEGR